MYGRVDSASGDRGWQPATRGDPGRKAGHMGERARTTSALCASSHKATWAMLGRAQHGSSVPRAGGDDGEGASHQLRNFGDAVEAEGQEGQEADVAVVAALALAGLARVVALRVRDAADEVDGGQTSGELREQDARDGESGQQRRQVLQIVLVRAEAGSRGSRPGRADSVRSSPPHRAVRSFCRTAGSS